MPVDAEIFNFRPGRFRTEEKLSSSSEWERLGKALSAVTAEPGINLIGPSHVLKLIDREGGGSLLQLESANCPVPVKKQPQIQPGALGRNGTRQHRHQCRLRARLSRHAESA